MESFLGHLLAGGVFCLFSGQPLTVLGCTGPVLIFEKILMDACLQYGFTYLTIRLWIGLWSSLFCIVIVAVDGSAIVRFDISITLLVLSMNGIFLQVLYKIYGGGLRCSGWNNIHCGVIEKDFQ